MSFRSMHSTFTFLACGLFISGLAMLLFIDPSSAQDASPPACDAHILTACAPNSGDTAWMLTSVALVLMMTIPGLGLFYGGWSTGRTLATRS